MSNTQTQFTYDTTWGNLQTSKTASFPAITYAYDPIGRMTGLTDQAGAGTTFTYAQNNPIMGVDPTGLWTFQIGLNGTGGGGAGGTAEVGIIFGYSHESGFHIGSYQSVGGGGYGGVSGSVGLNLSFSKNTDINQLNGKSGSVGGSVDLGLSLGTGASFNQGAQPSYSGSLGLGGGLTPIEEHGMLVNTWVQDWTSSKSGGCGH